MRRRFLARALRHGGFVAGAGLVGLLVLVALVSVVWTPHPVDQVRTAMKLRDASTTYLLGTDHLGRDVLSRLMVGAQTSVSVGLIAVSIGLVLGVALGAWAAQQRGWVDEILMRLTDLKLTLPSLILAMAVAAALGPSLVNTIIAITLSWWAGYARLVRGEVLAKREEVFVTAARALGASGLRILFRHIVPNIMSPIIVNVIGGGTTR